MRIKSVAVAALVLIVILTAVAGCTRGKGEVVSLAFVEGAFKEIYASDESLDLSNAYILVTYADGSVERVKVTADMVSGFSSAVATSSGKMTISYGGKSIDWIYRVTGSGGIQTTFRLKFGYTPGESFGSVTVSAEGVSGSSNGIYAVAFDLVLGSGIAIAESGITCGVSGFKSAVNADGSNIRIVLWSADGVTSLNEGATLVLFGISGSKGTLTVQNASVSDGVSDYTVPATSYTIG